MKLILDKGQDLFFTSDTHYSHSNICRATTRWNDAENLTRDFKSLDHMNNTLVDNINEVVGENDVLILGLVLFTSNIKAQVINWVNYEYQADIKVYFCQYKYEAEIIIFKAKYKYQSDKQGYWWWEGDDDGNDGGRNYSSNRLNVYRVKYKYQADYIVYLTTYEYEVKLTDKYINEIHN